MVPLAQLFFLVFACNCDVVSPQRISLSDCIYTFHVPRNDIRETCPRGTGHEDAEIMKQKINQLETTIMNMQQQLTTSSKTLELIITKYITTSPEGNQANDNMTVGANYIRYGHKSCPDTATVVYDGFVGKSHYSHSSKPGGGVNYLCLPRHPEWPSGVTGGYQSKSYIYGVEYEQNGSPLMPSTKEDNDVPCAVCEVSGRSQQMMIPAKLTCPTGWVLEYKGLLMAQHYGQTASDYVCVDSEMQVLTGGHEDKNGGLLYVVEAACGSLPCPPYVDGYEIACVVCTK